MQSTRPQTQKTSSHRRPISKVCARCRKRKTKCDVKFPECTPCKIAGVVCQGYDSTTGTEIPRSLVRSLENQIAELESRAGSLLEKTQNFPFLFASRIAQSTISVATPPSRSFFHSAVSEGLFLHPSCPPLPVVREQSSLERPKSPLPEMDHQKPSSRYGPLPTINLNTVPAAAIDRMIRNYTQIHLYQYPCVSESWLHDVLQRVLAEQQADTHSILTHGISPESGLDNFHYFVVFIVLAISSMSLTWRGELQARAASEIFYSSAVKHLRLMECGEIESLQASLLLAHYAHMNPEKADNWTCISNAVRIVLDLGLHKKLPDIMSAEQKLLRCQLFWVTYGMDRSMCAMIQLPLSFPEESITAELQFPFDDEIEDIHIATEMAKKKSSANHIYLYRGLEIEVHRVLHLQEDVGSVGEHGVYQWVQDISERLKVWYEKSHIFTEYRMLEFRDVQYNTLIGRLHRPTLRLRVRTPDDRRICLDATQALVQDYMKQSRQGRLFYPWHGVHILFESAVIALDACWLSRDCNSESLMVCVRYVLSVSLPDCLNILTRIGERWKEATRCADLLRPILARVSRWLYDPRTAVLDTEYGSDLVEEDIQKLLFSEGPLFGNISGTTDWLQSMNEVAESGALDASWSTFDENFFQWDPSCDFQTMEADIT